MNLAIMGQTIAGTLLRGTPSLISNKQSNQSEDIPRCTSEYKSTLLISFTYSVNTAMKCMFHEQEKVVRHGGSAKTF